MKARTSALLALVFASGLLAVPLRAGHSAVEPVPRPDAWWQDRHKAFNQRVAEVGSKARIIFIGDSITQGWEGDGKEVWSKYYAAREAVNLGIGGDRTQHVLWRLDNGNLAGLKPKVAVVMIGTNNSNGEDNTVEQIAEGVTAIVQKLRDRLPETKVLLVAIFPRGENPNPQRGKLLQINQILQKLGDNQQVFWLDFGHQFVTAEGRIPRELMPDFLHLSPKAYALWAESIEGLVSQILGDAPVKSAASGSALSGEWTWTINGPDGNPVTAPLTLKQDGGKVIGRFARGPDRWLEIENGKVVGDEFSWTVKRDRPDGGTMVYEMTGRVDGNQITGRSKTTMDGNPVEVDWSAKRD
ncbi:MAG: platelet-activating factor acetylhydrolase IB subunit [Limisphaerales bacterium]